CEDEQDPDQHFEGLQADRDRAVEDRAGGWKLLQAFLDPDQELMLDPGRMPRLAVQLLPRRRHAVEGLTDLVGCLRDDEPEQERDGGGGAEASGVLASPEEQVCFDARRHGVVLARPFTKALVLAGAGGILVAQPWPLLVPGAVLVLLGALLALRAVWRWERTHLVVTT